MKRRKILAIVLCAVMCFALVPAPGSAEEAQTEDLLTQAVESLTVDSDVFLEETFLTEEYPAEAVGTEDAETENDVILPTDEVVSEESETEEIVEEEDVIIEEEYAEAVNLSASGNGKNDDGSTVITGFAKLEVLSFTEPYKAGLEALRRRFPGELTVYIGGVPAAGDVDPFARPKGSEQKTLPVTWECVQDYDEWLYDYEFRPALTGYTLADSVEPPIITLHVDDIDIPELAPLPTEEQADIPFSELSYGVKLPSYYSGWDAGNMPPIRNQNPYGTCWAFSSIGGVELDLISDGKADPSSIDLSELHLAYFSKHSYTDPKGLNKGDTVSDPNYLTAGGSTLYAIRTMANLVGPVYESSAPYSSAESYSPSSKAAKSMTAVQLTGAYVLNPQDRDGIKTAIQLHGGVVASMMAHEDHYSATFNSYYTPGEWRSNHVVLLVGWDDNFPRNNFSSRYSTEKPKGDGAWLVRNSWGYDEESFYGYFWMSYYDRSLLLNSCTAFDAETSVYDHVYAYDSVAVGGQGYYELEPGVAVIQSFPVDAGEVVEAVGIQLYAGDSVAISVSDGNRTATGSCASTYEGFYLVRLNSKFTVQQRSNITVTVTLKNAGRIYFESPGKGDCYTASCGSGGFFIRHTNGYEQNTGADACIKLYTNDKVLATYTVSYDANGGSGAPSAQKKTQGQNLTLSSVKPSREGYTFLGWSTNRSATSAQYQAGGTYTADASATLYAVWKELAPSVILRSANVDFDGLIHLLFKYDIGGVRQNLRDKTYVVFRIGNTELARFALNRGEATDTNETFYYHCPVPIVNYTDIIRVSVENENGREISTTTGKGKSVSGGYPYSLQNYAENKASSTNPKMAALAKALQDYGIAARLYAGQSVGSLSLSRAVTGLNVNDMQVSETVTWGTRPEGVKVSQNVLFESDNSLAVKFTLGSGKYTYKLDGASVTPKVNNGTATLTVSNIAPDRLNAKHVFSISDGKQTFTVETSVLGYAKRKAESGSDGMKNLAKALYVYANAASAYQSQ